MPRLPPVSSLRGPTGLSWSCSPCSEGPAPSGPGRPGSHLDTFRGMSPPPLEWPNHTADAGAVTPVDRVAVRFLLCFDSAKGFAGAPQLDTRAAARLRERVDVALSLLDMPGAAAFTGLAVQETRFRQRWRLTPSH